LKAYKRNRSGEKKSDYIKVLDDVIVVESFFERLFGLMLRPKLERGQGLLIPGCNSIHTMWMKYPIDVIFLDKQIRIVEMIDCLKPFKFSKIIKKSDSVLELPGKSITAYDLKVDDMLRFF